MSDAAAAFERLVESLSRPGVLEEGAPAPDAKEETHISVVLLAGERAYKLKKPVDLGFLDFGDRAKRQAACREELRLNRRLAPAVYLGLAPVWIEDDGSARVGEPVDAPPPCDELIVVMRRLPADRMLDRLIDDGRVEADQVDRLARQMAGFHATAPRGADVAGHGTRERVREIIEENLAEVRRAPVEVTDDRAQRLLGERLRGFLDTRGPLFARRVREERVRDTHGDLHAQNVCVLADGTPVVYDCLEFSPRLRRTDVAAEVAFLWMDLIAHGRADLADRFVAAYVEASGDGVLRQLLPFYGSYRAIVRAKVLALRAGGGGPRADAMAAAAARRHELAVQLSEGLAPGCLVVLAGLPGTGKTTVGSAIGARCGVDLIESDRVRKRLAGRDPKAPAPARPGEGIYTEAMTGATYRSMLREARERLGRGESVLLAGTFLKRDQRAAVVDVAASAGTVLLFVELVAPEDTVLARVERREPGVSDADAEVYRYLSAARDPFREIPAESLLTLDTSSRSPDELGQTVLARLRRPFDREAG